MCVFSKAGEEEGLRMRIPRPGDRFGVVRLNDTAALVDAGEPGVVFCLESGIRLEIVGIPSAIQRAAGIPGQASAQATFFTDTAFGPSEDGLFFDGGRPVMMRDLEEGVESMRGTVVQARGLPMSRIEREFETTSEMGTAAAAAA